MPRAHILTISALLAAVVTGGHTEETPMPSITLTVYSDYV